MFFFLLFFLKKKNRFTEYFLRVKFNTFIQRMEFTQKR